MSNCASRTAMIGLRVGSFIFAVALVLCGFVTLRAQDERQPQRGFHPGNSYSLSDLETISLSSGNLMLNIPLGGLPPGRGGHGGFGLSLTYNSKLYDSHVDEVPNSEGQSENRSHLNDSQLGGWRYTMPVGFTMRLVGRLDQEPGPPCTAATGAFSYRKNAFIWKMQVTYPDGSTHEFRPAGYDDLFDDGFFDISANGWRYNVSYGTVGSDSEPVCSQSRTLETTQPLVYYSTDGSYTKLVVEHDNDPNDQVGGNNPWTLFFADGSRVSGNRPDEPQRLRDRNNNYVEVQHTTHNGHPATRIVDQLGRYLIIEVDSQFDPVTGRETRQDYVYVQGVGGEELRWTIRWKEIYVFKQYIATVEGGGIGHGNRYLTPLVFTFLVIDQITLPAQAGSLTYSFGYNAGDCIGDCEKQTTLSHGWGELSSVTLPSGATASYTYALDGVSATTGSVLPTWKNVLNNKPTRKQLVYRPEYDLVAISNTPCNPTVDSCITDTWVYSPTSPIGTANPRISSITGPDGGVYQEFFITDANSPFAGRTLSSIRPDGVKVENLWAENRAPGMNGRSVNPFIKTVFTSVRNAGGTFTKTAIKDYDYDKNGNVTRVREYDWVAYDQVLRDTTGHPTGIPAISPSRITTNSYYAATPDALDTTTDDADIYHRLSSPRLLKAVANTEVSGGSTLSRVEFVYDNATTTGNLTQQRMWDSTRGGLTRPLTAGNSITVTHAYDIYGNRTRSTDARGVQTEYVYGPVGGVSDLYVTQTRVAPGTPVERTMQHGYDFFRGLTTSETDVENSVTNQTSYDALGRPTLVQEAVGTAVARQTSTEYSDAERRVIVRADQNTTGDRKLVSIQHYDQLGRIRLTRQLENAAVESAFDERSGIKVQTRYLNTNPGSFLLTSNPYRANTSAEAQTESTMGWTLSRSDQTGRPVEVRSFSGSGLPGPWGTNASTTGATTTFYNAEDTTVTDQAGKVRRSLIDSLGRLARIDEPADASNGLGSLSAPLQPTSYTYDALNNLTQVAQGSQSRFFSYSSLSRLTAANNPEIGGAVSYQYDPNGNLTRKADPRVSTDYVYDDLNRIVSRSYSDGTPQVTYEYDASTVAHSRGRLTRVSSTVSAYDYLEYDQRGFVRRTRQTTRNQAFPMECSYNLAGNITSETYPSGRVVTTTYDTAGRVQQVQGQNAGQQPTLYVSQAAYAVHGAPSEMRLGNGLWEHMNYNARLQPVQIGLGTSGSDSSVFGLTYGYGSSDNNGNVRSQTITAPTNGGGTLTVTQNYNYDHLNRLSSAAEGSNWSQSYGYDRYGNRWVTAASTYVPTPALTPRQQSDFSATNNRLVKSGFQYDAAGNLKSDPVAGADAMLYDGDNRLKSYRAPGSPAIITTYQYDGEGRRVLKENGVVSTIFVYNVTGQLVAEYDNAGTAVPGTSYLTTDHLGSTRVVTDAARTVKARYDYLPFGEEIGSNIGSRNSVDGYLTADSTRQKFTQKERESESGLDYFLARYYSGAQGRFTSPDAPLVGQHAEDSQSWNLFGYARNNPLLYVDPTGEEWVLYEYDKDNKLINTYQVADIADLEGYKIYGGNEEGTTLYLTGPNGTRFTAKFFDPGGYLVNAISNDSDVILATLSLSAPAMNQAIAAFGGGTAVAGVIGGGALFASSAMAGSGVTTLGLSQSGSASATLVAGEQGAIIGWGTNQTVQQVAKTQQVTASLTTKKVAEMAAQGLSRQWVQKQLAMYTAAIAKGGRKLDNTQLRSRKELMEKILSLWPK